MTFFKDSLHELKNKRDIKKKLEFHKQFILGKLEEKNLNSALDKTRSALTLIKEYKDSYNLDNKFKEFKRLNKSITEKINKYRSTYFNRFKKYTKQRLTEENLERFMKLLASLKDRIDNIADSYNLYEIQEEINRYFEFLKMTYTILTTYKVLTYELISEKIFQLLEQLDYASFSNLQEFIEKIFQKVIIRKLEEIAHKKDNIALSELSDILALKHEELLDILQEIMDSHETPIKVLNKTNDLIIFRY